MKNLVVCPPLDRGSSQNDLLVGLAKTRSNRRIIDNAQKVRVNLVNVRGRGVSPKPFCKYAQLFMVHRCQCGDVAHYLPYGLLSPVNEVIPTRRFGLKLLGELFPEIGGGLRS